VTSSPWEAYRATGSLHSTPPGAILPPNELDLLASAEMKAIVQNGGQESACGWCKDRWGVSWQITPRVLTEAMAAGGAEAKRAFDAMMDMKKIDVAAIEAARRGGGEKSGSKAA